MANWEISADKFIADDIPWHGNKYLAGNGYMGVRGTMEEYTKENMCGINMSGIYDRVGDAWRESVNAPNVLYTYVAINGKKYVLPDEKPLSHLQKLDFRNGIHIRETQWQTEDGKITVRSERIVSMVRQHVIAMKYSVITDFECEAEIVTGIDGDVWDINGPHFAELKLSKEEKSVKGITGEKKISVTAAENVNVCFDKAVCTVSEEDKKVMEHIAFKACAGVEYTIEKAAIIYSSADEEPCSDNVKALNYEQLKAEHIDAWAKIWDISEITIEGDDEAMSALNYSLYHMNCIAPRGMRSRSIPARGLSGQVYKGAIFWDTEMFMLDYFAYTEPQIAKTLLTYRIDTLDGAREKAAYYGLDGAYYAWESQEDGSDACSDYNVVDVFTKRPMRTHFRDKQYHISAAVVYGMMKYMQACGDKSILSQGGAEVIIECARMYRSLLLKRANSDFYEIHDVVGPDEYHERVSNNAYTNRMAKFVLEEASKTITEIKVGMPECYEELKSKFELDKLAVEFEALAQKLYIPSPSENGIIEQFDGYFRLEDVSVDTVRSRLLDPKEYWGGAYGVASDTQVIKQADVVAMLSMFRDDYDVDTMARNWEFYEPRTEHGSSLSACMYSLLACYIGNPDFAYPLFMKSASADLLPGGKQWAGLIYIGGTHPASEGGAWIVAVKGFAGVSIENGQLVCRPSLPEKWKKMKFKMVYCGKVYSIEAENGKGTVTEIE